MEKKIRVLIVDDSALFRQMIINHLSANPNIEVIGYAINAFDARKKIPELKPDVVTMDVEMPGMSGIDLIKQLIPEYPIPVVLVSSLNINVFEALSAGAVDFVPKPDMSGPDSKTKFFERLTDKVITASRTHVKTHVRSSGPMKGVGTTALLKNALPALPHTVIDSTIVAIGASTGGTEATLAVLEKLPSSMPGIVVTQHMPAGFTAMYAQRLNNICKLEVKEAQNGDIIRPGLVLIAPGGLQMEVARSGRDHIVRCFDAEKVSGHRPSVDVLFSSMAKNVSMRKVGIIMTGMGSDGANGLLEMSKKGAYTIGQDKESCVVYGMPMVAYNLGAVKIQASCDNIPSVLMKYLSSQ